jgi:hypothetical protein
VLTRPIDRFHSLTVSLTMTRDSTGAGIILHRRDSV